MQAVYLRICAKRASKCALYYVHDELDNRTDGLAGFVNTPMVNARSNLDASRMIQPEDVAHTIAFVLKVRVAKLSLANHSDYESQFPTTACPTEVVLRPQRTPYIAT